MGRATYLGRDVIDVVCNDGIEVLEDFWDDLETIEGMTNMESVSQQPFPVAGVWSSREPRSFVIAGPSSQNQGMMLGGGAGWPVGGGGGSSTGAAGAGIQNHVARQFKARLMRENR